jgi:hypothetical protein
MLYWPVILGSSFHARFGDRLSWPACAGMILLLIGLTFVLSGAVGKVYDAVLGGRRAPREARRLSTGQRLEALRLGGWRSGDRRPQVEGPGDDSCRCALDERLVPRTI